MANVQHSTLTDPNLHEPKGIASASANQVYISDGSGSGDWTNANRLPGTGYGYYTNTTYTGVNALAISTTEVLLPFTTAALATQLPITYGGTETALMDLATETLQFVAAGDLHALTLNFTIYSASGSPASMDLNLYGSSDGSTYGTLLASVTETLTKGSGQVVTSTSLFPITSDLATYGAQIKLVTNTGTANIIDIGLISARVHKAR